MSECERRCVGHYTSPKPMVGQVRYCKGGGCETVTTKVIDEWCFRETNGDTVLREDYYTVEVCSSCDGDIGVWDTITDTEVDCDYEFEGIDA